MIKVLNQESSLVDSIKRLGLEISEEEINKLIENLHQFNANHQEPIEKMHPLTRTFYRLSKLTEEKEFHPTTINPAS